MRWLIALLVLVWACPVGAVDCSACHRREADEFARSAMARAASSPDFHASQSETGQSGTCRSCHAPSGGNGLVCGDCHGADGHGRATGLAAEVCARCHDAPGENTVRSAAAGTDCRVCHAAGHDFQGPSQPGFLDGVARLDLHLRRETENWTALLRISHRAGHALPGGTTGRSVWVEIVGRNERGLPVWRDLRRFGWVRDGQGHWKDLSLVRGRPAIVEFAIPNRSGALFVEARAVYRFRPGPFDEPDPRAVVLDSAVRALPKRRNER